MQFQRFLSTVIRVSVAQKPINYFLAPMLATLTFFSYVSILGVQVSKLSKLSKKIKFQTVLDRLGHSWTGLDTLGQTWTAQFTNYFSSA